MSKVDILRLDSVTTNDTKATTTINTNFQNIQNVIETLLSRTGVTPNYMDAVLDMNSYRIINTAIPIEDFDVVNLKYLKDYVGSLDTLVSQATKAAQAALAQAQNAAASSNIAVTSAQVATNALETLTTTATDNFNQNATNKTNTFNANAIQKTEQINSIASSISDLVVGFDENVATKTSEFNQNATNKTKTCNSNADSKTQSFNTNASEKQALVNAGALSAQTSATNAENSETNAKSYSEQAESSATTATQMSNSASTYATTATTQAEIATTQAGIATTKAQEASESAVTATSKASIATTKAQEASTSATNAQNSATSAQTSSNLSQNWAIKTDGPVSGNEYSAKYWAEQASAGQLQADWNQTDTTQKDYIKNKPTKLSQFTNDTNFVNTTQLATKQDKLTTTQLNAVNSGITSDKVSAYDGYQTQINNRQLTSNLSQTIDNSTTKYPSNKAVKAAIDAKDSLPSQSGQSGKFLTTDGTTASWGDSYHPDLLSFQWSDHLLNNVSWLRADTFSWQDGTVYASVYQHLTNDITGISPTTETIGSNTITVYTATDGHKIVLADQAQTVQDIYNETGISWYFILDTTNQRFKLPRTKFGFTGFIDSVGKYVTESLPNIKGGGAGEIGWTTANTPTGAFYKDKDTPSINGSFASKGGTYSLAFDASRSSSTYKDNAPVQQRATQMYLYFYVGDYTKTALEQTAGLNAELFNGKLDTDLSNMNASQTAKETIIGWGMPDYTAGITISTGSYTPQIDGLIIVSGGNNNTNKYIDVNGARAASAYVNSTTSTDIIAFVQKGDTIAIIGTGVEVYFYPLKGAN